MEPSPPTVADPSFIVVSGTVGVVVAGGVVD